MKRILYALALVCLITSTGCHKDTETANTNVEQLVIGKWRENSKTSVYFVAGKEVYRESKSVATNPTDEYIEFRADNVYADFFLNGSNYIQTKGTYSITDSYSVLHLSIGGQSAVFPFYYQDNSNISVVTTITGGIVYIKDNVGYNADSAIVTTYMVRM